MAEPERTVMVPAEDLTAEELNILRGMAESALAKAKEGDFSGIDGLYDKIPKLVRCVAEQMLRADRGIAEWFGELGKGPSLYLDSMREDLGYATAGALERLLVDRILACWLRVQQAEHIKTAKDKDGITLQWATVWERRLAIAHRNFLSACKSLAQVRRLLRPRIAQVNIGEQQINVAQVEAGDGD